MYKYTNSHPATNVIRMANVLRTIVTYVFTYIYCMYINYN